MTNFQENLEGEAVSKEERIQQIRKQLATLSTDEELRKQHGVNFDSKMITETRQSDNEIKVQLEAELKELES